MAVYIGLLSLFLAAVAAFPSDPVLIKLDDGLRYQHVQGPDGKLHLSDSWMKASDLEEVARFNPDRQNVYHLFTRENPSVSQPLLTGVEGLLGLTNYNPRRRTVVLVHGWLDNAASDFNTVLVPAFLAAEDLNVIVVDWSAGAGSINYFTALANTVPAGLSVARFIAWLNRATSAVPSMYHLVGHSLGGHMVGIIGRNLGGEVAYITALDPAGPGWINNNDRFRPNDGAYTEVIHTNAGVLGFLATLGHADFYPNGGLGMPGCDSQECDHLRGIFYLAESLTSGGFNGRRCASYLTAMTGNCFLWGNLRMGGLVPKTGSSGIFYLETNASPPFSRN
ncbi:pancreatic triacylglycerol lipase [Manduca sexta]|uniref:pancreatic triacylglycerol lipase n=1 Tax=Manduca sexta TaxID=7130 RepID=UPI00188E2B94|nr:pancreatic triacylglycerol lipase [Manduca sexta]